MPSRSPRACTRCGTPIPNGLTCPMCEPERRARDNTNRNPANRAYGTTAHRRRFRLTVLKRDPICVICNAAIATVADHHPRTRKQLIADGADPNDPAHGRGLCWSCHSRSTAENPDTRGGWNRR